MDFSFDKLKEYTDQTFKQVNYAGKQINQRTFEGCTFSGCTFTQTAFNACKFRDCTFKDCDLRLATMIDSVFSHSQMEQSKVTGINWTVSGWVRGGLFTPIQFNDCDISQCVFMGLNLKKIRMIKCVAKNADFAEADMSHADCTYTDFAESRFLHTNLTEADFTNAFNYTIVASVNTLKKAKFSLPEATNLLYGLDIVIVKS